MKRFWKDVSVADGEIRLDDRPVRTPGRVPLTTPAPALTMAIADEWRMIEGEIDPRAMPLTGLANAAIDRITSDPATFAASLARYSESDLLCYRADSPAALVARQHALWDPPLDWATHRYDVHFEIATGIMHRAQPPATIERLNEAVAARAAFELAGLSPVVTVSGSLVIGLALIERAQATEALWDAADLDEAWQAEKWGEDDLATRTRAARRAEFEAGARFLRLLNS